MNKPKPPSTRLVVERIPGIILIGGAIIIVMVLILGAIKLG